MTNSWVVTENSQHLGLLRSLHMELMIDSQRTVRARGNRDVMRDLTSCWSNETCCAIRVSPPFTVSVSRVGMK